MSLPVTTEGVPQTAERELALPCPACLSDGPDARLLPWAGALEVTP